MATSKEEIKVGDFTEVFKELSGLVKENYLLGFETIASLIEENQKFVNSQLDQYLSLQKEFADSIKAAYEGLPKGFNGLPFSSNFDHLTEVQREYVGLVRNLYDKFSKNSLTLTQKATENAFKALDNCIRLFNI